MSECGARGPDETALSAAWKDALDTWDVSVTLSPPQPFAGKRASDGKGDEPLAYIDLETRQVVVNLELLEKLGASSSLTAVLAHEIGHHVRYPHSLALAASLQVLEKRLVPGLRQSLTNLFFDLLVNEYVGRTRRDELCRVYQGFVKGGEPPVPLFSFYLAVYEELWGKPAGFLVPKAALATMNKAYPGWRAEARLFVQTFYSLPGIHLQFVHFCSRFVRYIPDPEKLVYVIPLGHDVPAPDEDALDAAVRGFGAEEADAALREARERGLLDQSGLEERAADNPLESIDKMTRHLPGHSAAAFKQALVSRHYKRLVNQHIIKPPPASAAPEPSLPSITEEWEWGDNPRAIDWTATLLARGALGSAQPLQRTLEPEEPSPRVVAFPAVEIYLDTSGSMPNPATALNAMTLAAQILAASALRKQGVVRVIISDSDFLANVQGPGAMDALRFGVDKSRLVVAFLAIDGEWARKALAPVLGSPRFRLAPVPSLNDFGRAAASLADARFGRWPRSGHRPPRREAASHARLARVGRAAHREAPSPARGPGRGQAGAFRVRSRRPKGRGMTETNDLSMLFPTREAIPADVRHEPDDVGLTLLIDGQARRWAGPSEPIRSAVCVREGDGRLERLKLGPGALASAVEAREAVEAASRAWAGGRGEWPRASTGERIACMRDFVRRALPLREPVARALMWEVGKPWPDCLKEFDRTIEYIEATAEALRQIERAAAAPVPAGGFVARICRAPLGVALCLGPYNYAVNEVFTTVIPALVMGNPVVMKTPRYGVLANALLVPALQASFPKGAVNLVTGQGPTVVGPMMESGLVDVLALIGSARTAGILLKQHPHPYRLRTLLGMGAKNPAIVLADADLDAATAEIVSGALNFNGQRCTALKHVLVMREVSDALVERLADQVARLKVGMPWEKGVAITPLPDPEKPGHLASLVEDATGRGARVVNPGGGEWAGTLFRPALVYPVPETAQLFRVEQFGPILPVSVVDSPEEALGVIDRSEVGQQASVFGRDAAMIGRLVDHLANLVCRVNLNTQCRRGPDVYPFAGRKESAVGTLSVTDALRVFSIRSLVAVPDGERSLLDEVSATSVFLSPPPD